MAGKHNLKDLDAGQLEFMWDMMKLRKGGASKNDVQALKGYLDAIRQAMVQMTGGEHTLTAQRTDGIRCHRPVTQPDHQHGRLRT